MTEKRKPTTTLAEQMDALRKRLGLPALPLPPEDAPPPPRPLTEVDDDQRNEESER